MSFLPERSNTKFTRDSPELWECQFRRCSLACTMFDRSYGGFEGWSSLGYYGEMEHGILYMSIMSEVKCGCTFRLVDKHTDEILPAELFPLT